MDTVNLRPAPAATPTDVRAGESPVQPNPLKVKAARLWRGPDTDPVWARPALVALLVATAALYLWNLTASGWANSFYTAAVQAGSLSWKAFLFGSFDASNAITVDKPPASLWVMALSVRLLGLSSFAVLAPQALMGVGTVAAVHATVKRQFGAAAGLLAGAVVALTPVAALMFTFNNPDALLTLSMALAAWATMRAIEAASPRWLAVAGVLVGLGFLTKTLQVLLVVPFLGVAYLVAAPATLRRRLVHSLVAVGAAVVTAGWWVALVELVPASARPYIGGSQTNSFLELTFGYNGLGRLNGEETGSVGGARGWGETGLLRMFSSSVGDQVSWLIPSALILLVAGLALRGRRPRTDLRRAAYLVWGGWLVVTMLVFSLMAGIFHEYYTVALAPAIGALGGMGATDAWERRDGLVGTVALTLAVAAAAVWGFALLGSTTAYPGWFRYAVLVVGLLAAVALGLGWVLRGGAVGRPVALGALAAGVVAALAGPSAYSASTTAIGHTGSIVYAGPAERSAGTGPGGQPGGLGAPGPDGTAMRDGRGGSQGMPGPGTGTPPGMGTMPDGGTRGGRPGGLGGLLDATTPSDELVAALTDDADSYTWVAATVGSQNAAGLQIATQHPVMAIGGFNGSDPSPTLEQFQQYVAEGRIHYFAGGGAGFRGQAGGSDSGSSIASWVQANFEQVTIGGTTVYDLTAPTGGVGPASAGGATPAT